MKHKLALIISFIMMVMLFSCAEPSLNETPSAPDTPAEQLSIQAQINEAISRLGVVNRVYSNSSAVAPTSSSRAIVSSKLPKESVIVDGKELDLYTILAEYDNVSGVIAEHLSKLASSDEGRHPGSSFDISTINGKIYIEYRFFYFKGTSDLAFMEVRMYDNLAIDTSFKLTEFSKDFVYDIINQIRMTDGAKVGFNWEEQEEKDADRFVVITTEPSIPPFRTDLKQMWVLLDDDDEMVTHSCSAGMYLQEIPLTEEISTFFKDPGFHAYTIDGTPEIDGYYGTYDENSAYVRIQKYPPRFRSAYSIWAYWFENGRWNATEHTFADDNYRIKSWKQVIDENEITSIKNIVSFMGTPTIIHQQYIGDDKVTQVWNENIQGAYIIEFSSFKEGAKQATMAFNSNGREYEYEFKYSEAGPLLSDTVATVELLVYSNGYKCAVIKFKNGNAVYDSYGWLTIRGNTINGMNVDNPDADGEWISLRGYSDKYVLLNESDYPEPVFGKPIRIWQLKDEKGNNVTARHTAGFYIYELPMTFQDKALLEEHQDGDTDDKNPVLNNYGNINAKTDCIYANVMPTPTGHRTPCFIDFTWWDGDGWQYTVGMQADEQRNMMLWKDIDSTDPVFGPLYKGIEENIGEIESVKQLYAGNQPRLTVWGEAILGDYVLELETCNPKLRDAIKNPSFKKNFSLYYDEAGRLDDDTVCTMHILYYGDNRIATSIMIYGEENDGSWDNSYSFLPCSKDFSRVNGISMNAENIYDGWVKNSFYAKGEYIEIDNKEEAGFYTANRIWRKQGGLYDHETARHIIEVNPNADITKLTERYENHDVCNPYLNIDGFINENADTESIYMEIHETKTRYRYDLYYYWHEEDGWHNTIMLRAVDNQTVLTWVDATQSSHEAITALKPLLAKIGTISKIYLCYEGDNPYRGEWNTYDYVVEFSDYKKNIIPALDNGNEEVSRNIYYKHTEAGTIQDETKCTMEIERSSNNSYSSSFALRKENGSWDYYYYHLDCGLDFSIINGFDVATGTIPDYWYNSEGWNKGHYQKLTDLSQPGFYEPTRVWQMYDENGAPEQNGYTLGNYIIEVPFDENLKSLTKKYACPGKYNKLTILGHTFGNPKKESAYVLIAKTSDIDVPYTLEYYWYEEGYWHFTTRINATGDRSLINWIDVTVSDDPEIGAIREELSHIGTINRIFQWQVNDKPYQNSYIAEFTSTNANHLITALDHNNKEVRRDEYLDICRAGTISNDTVCIMDFRLTQEGEYSSTFDINKQPGSFDHWDSYYVELPCNKDFTVINGINITTGESVIQ